MDLTDQIALLKGEIQSYQVEISRLEQEMAHLSKSTALSASSPAGIADAIRKNALESPARQAELQGIKNAIAELTSRLNQKQQQFAELKKERQHQLHLAQLAQGRQEIRSKVGEVEAAAQSLRSLYLELKLLASRYEPDFQALYPTSSAAFRFLNIYSLIDFQQLSIPKLDEQEGRFTLSCASFDVYAAEKLRQKEEEQRKFLRLQAQADEQARVMQQQREREQQQRECERLTSLLEQKKLERAYLLDQKSIWGSSMNVDRLTAKIEALDVEITEMQCQINALMTDAAV